MKTNPDKQISKIKESKSKDVIRLIKLYRHFNGFKFKSFFLEIFIVDLVEPTYEENDTLFDKLVKFAAKYEEIGQTKIYDPANYNNNIMDIHTEEDFLVVRQYIKVLYEVLMTYNDNIIENCILGKKVDIDKA